MRRKKILAFIITMAMMFSASFTINVLAAEDETAADASGNDGLILVDGGSKDDDININIDVNVDAAEPEAPIIPFAEQKPEYAFVSGKIESVEDQRIPLGGIRFTTRKAVTVISGEGEEESTWVFFIDSSTAFITGGKKDLKAGASVRAFYNINAPMTMIYPPQIKADFIAVGLDEDKFVAIDKFDGKLTDTKNKLKLNIPEDFNEKDSTVIIFEDGEKFDGEIAALADRTLVVIYSVTTRSIPAQTTPEKIIIMFEKAVNPVYNFTAEEKAIIAKFLEEAAVSVNGGEIESPGLFMSDSGIVMVPVRAIAEALDLSVEWLGETQTVKIGKNLTFKIGADEYSYDAENYVKLGAAPVIKGGKTYVPINFFTARAIDELEIMYNFVYIESVVIINIISVSK